jgi:hypothetical protein
MEVWLTYSLSDFLLFSPRTYFRLVELYNRAVWPGQVSAVGLGLLIVALLVRRPPWHGRAIAGILAGSWLWIALAFHLHRYATINWAASYLAAGFALQGALLAWIGVVRGRLAFRRPRRDPVAVAGWCLFGFALTLQPLLGQIGERPWPSVELFALTPDPTTVATLGLLAATADRVAWELLVVPLLWCAVSGATAWAMSTPDALVMPLVALASLGLAIRKTWRGRA